jgi:RNA polymerase sigma-70 factor (ECF subfamily)
VASVLRMTGDLAVAEDAVQEACLAALAQWPDRGWPDQPRAWLTGVARHKAVDLIRREAARSRKEAAAVRDLASLGEPEPQPGPAGLGGPGGDELGLVFMCCHPALALEARVALTLRCVCGLSTAQIAAGFLVPEATMARRLSRAKAKIADSGIRLRQPAPDERPSRLAAVLCRWPQLHLARADLLARAGRAADAVAAYRAALELEPTAPERAFIARRIGELRSGQ